ncbi:MAG TPA: hypothetical protein VHM88_21405, partial [Candidatus Acidoferrales bacterium]|nr:hypothetical protein [Candidatus Acidoferrales bacterium]
MPSRLSRHYVQEYFRPVQQQRLDADDSRSHAGPATTFRGEGHSDRGPDVCGLGSIRIDDRHHTEYLGKALAPAHTRTQVG